MARSLQVAKLVISVVVAMSIAPEAAATHPDHFACPTNVDLIVKRTAVFARVSLDGRTYELHRKPSSIGEKYISAHAALIIDGDSAVFVAEDRLDLGACVRNVPLVAAR